MTLTDKIQAATGPSRMLDAQIHAIHGPADYPNPFGTERFGIYSLPCPAYTASIDAALTLVPEGMFPLIDCRGPHCRMRFADGLDVDGAHSLAATPALAIVAAALKAHEAQESE